MKEPNIQTVTQAFNDYLTEFISSPDCVDESLPTESEEFTEGYALGVENSVRAFERFLQDDKAAAQLFTHLILRGPL